MEGKERVLVWVADKKIQEKQFSELQAKYGDVSIIHIKPEDFTTDRFLQLTKQKDVAEVITEQKNIEMVSDNLKHILTEPVESKKENIRRSYEEDIERYAKDSMIDYVHHGLHRDDMDFDYLEQAAKAHVISLDGMEGNSLQETAVEKSDLIEKGDMEELKNKFGEDELER